MLDIGLYSNLTSFLVDTKIVLCLTFLLSSNGCLMLLIALVSVLVSWLIRTSATMTKMILVTSLIVLSKI